MGDNNNVSGYLKCIIFNIPIAPIIYLLLNESKTLLLHEYPSPTLIHTPIIYVSCKAALQILLHRGNYWPSINIIVTSIMLMSLICMPDADTIHTLQLQPSSTQRQDAALINQTYLITTNKLQQQI